MEVPSMTMKREITVTVNGQEYHSEVEPRMLLVHYLREMLDLTGTHIGCDTSQCGACTVLLNGESVKSCTVLAVQADGCEVTTIEGLAPEGSLHPIQEGFWEKHGLQCGFCTPGMIMASYNLLKHNPNPSEEEIRTALKGNICRCTGYQNIVTSVQYAAEQMGTVTSAPVGAAEQTCSKARLYVFSHFLLFLLMSQDRRTMGIAATAGTPIKRREER